MTGIDRLRAFKSPLSEPFRDGLSAQREHVEGQLQVATESTLEALEREGDAAGHAQLNNAWRTRRRASPQPRDSKIRIAILPFAKHDATCSELFWQRAC